MKNQKKCPSCGKWTDGSKDYCVFCDSLINPVLIQKAEQERKAQIRRSEQLANENKFEKYLRKLEESDKPGHVIAFKILSTAFSIYMGILSFFIWLIALISG